MKRASKRKEYASVAITKQARDRFAKAIRPHPFSRLDLASNVIERICDGLERGLSASHIGDAEEARATRAAVLGMSEDIRVRIRAAKTALARAVDAVAELDLILEELEPLGAKE